MKITCKKVPDGVDYTYLDGKPDGDFDVVICYKANSDKEVSEVADMLVHVADFIRQWKYSKEIQEVKGGNNDMQKTNVTINLDAKDFTHSLERIVSSLTKIEEGLQKICSILKPNKAKVNISFKNEE